MATSGSKVQQFWKVQQADNWPSRRLEHRRFLLGIYIPVSNGLGRAIRGRCEFHVGLGSEPNAFSAMTAESSSPNEYFQQAYQNTSQVSFPQVFLRWVAVRATLDESLTVLRVSLSTCFRSSLSLCHEVHFVRFEQKIKSFTCSNNSWSLGDSR